MLCSALKILVGDLYWKVGRFVKTLLHSFPFLQNLGIHGLVKDGSG
uniref:Uncharacterized protein n=1 Tax=Arundo donax TaxID=35708 RepID=A0A0A9ANQ9_ARUDO